MFKKLDVITKILQDDCLNLADVRACFDVVIEDFPIAQNFLSENAGIFDDNFKKIESGLVKILNNQLSAMDNQEIEATASLKLIGSNNDNTNNSDDFIILERAVKWRNSSIGVETKYIDCRFVLPTSNHCERLFSVAGYALGSRRCNIEQANFGKQMFLFANKHLWTIGDINVVVNLEE